MANGYSTYVSPVNRMGAIAGVGGEIQRQRFERQEQPLRMGIMQEQLRGVELANMSEEQRMRMLDEKIKTSNIAADAFELMNAPDDQLLPALQQRMPDFAASAMQSGASPDEIRNRLGGIVQRGAMLGAIKLPEAPKQPTAPSSVREYEYARSQGYKGTFQDFQTEQKKAGANNLTVNTGADGNQYGPPPKDHAWARNSDGSIALTDAGNGFSAPIAVPISGGPADVKSKANERKTQATRSAREMTAKIVSEDIDRVTEIIDKSPITTTGAVGKLLSGVGGTEAGNVSALLDTISANIGFDKLQAMREASPTGGALGQVSNLEIGLLQSVFGSLKQSQTKEQLKYNLQRLKDTYLDIVHGPGNRPGEARKSIDEYTVEELEALPIEELERIANGDD